MNCTLSVVAVDEPGVIATIPLPGRPRWAIYDAATEPQIVKAFDVPATGPLGLSIRDAFLPGSTSAAVFVER